MYRHRFLALLAWMVWITTLAGCASSTPRMAQVRSLAAAAPRLRAYAELTEHFRATYQREQPWLSPSADRREHDLDLQRQAACDDFIALHRSLQAYLNALGRLAGDNQYDLEDQIKGLGSGIKAWPDSGLDDRHVNAYAGLTRLLSRALSSRYQDQAVQQLLRDGASPVRTLLDALGALLRYYDKTNDNEARLVLGTLDVEIPYIDTPPQRLLAALAKSERQSRSNEYRLWGRRYKLAEHSVAEIARQHQALLEQLDQPIP
ncbi:MAG: hypothetical protein ACEQSK_08605 [Sphingomonadaceae bacterium]